MGSDASDLTAVMGADPCAKHNGHAFGKRRETMDRLLQQLEIGILQLDKDGSIRYAEGRVLTRFGIDPKEATGKHVQPYAVNVPRMWDAVERALHGQGGRYVLWGNEAVMDVTLLPENDRSGQVMRVLGYISDITAAEQIMRAHEEQQERFSDVAKLVYDVIWETDVEGKVTYVSSPEQDIYGYMPEEVVGKRYIFDFISDESRKEAEFLWRSRIYFGKLMNASKTVIRKKNGDLCYVMTYGRPLYTPEGDLRGFRGIDLNITVQEQSRQMLLRNEAKFMKAQHIAKVGYWELHYKENMFVCSEESYCIFQETPAAGQSFQYYMRLVHPEDRDAVISTFSHAVMNNEPYSQDYRVLLRDGTIKHVHVIATTTYDEKDGFPVLSSGTVQDVTEFKRVQLELIEAKKAAEHANLAKSAFLANISHEIRTPMNGIIGFLDLLRMSPLSREQQELLEEAKNASKLLLHLIGDILDVSGIEAGRLAMEKRRFSVRQLLKNAMRMFMPLAEEKRLLLQTDIDAGVPDAFRGDGMRLMQVIGNLLSNAIKFTERGAVTLRVWAEDRTADAATLCVEVRDTGIGISQAQQRELFQLFSQVDSSATRRHGGAGLGLAISRKIVELMGGGITCESRPNAGAVFRFHVRLETVEQLPEGAWAEAPRAIPVRSNARILIVDDNAMNLLLLSKVLEKRGIRFETARNGREAVEAVKRQTYDMVLMDCQMPEMDGFEATACIRRIEHAQRRATPIIALTAGAMVDERDRCLSAGMDGYLSKPIKMEELFEEMEKFLR